MIPTKYSNVKIRMKFCLSSYRASEDCRYAIERFQNQSFTFSQWKVGWAGICSLLNTSIHLMRNKDAKACIPTPIRNSFIEVWNEIGRDRTEHPIYWEFIRRERNNVLKEYEFSAYEAIMSPDGTTRPIRSLLHILNKDETETLIIRGGFFDGRLALDVANEAVDWVQKTILGALTRVGFDPDAEVELGKFLIPR